MSFTPSTKSVAQKLGVEEGTRVFLLGPLPALELPRVRRVRREADVVMVAVVTSKDLARVVEGALSARSDGGRLWLCYEKGGAVSREDIGAVLDQTPSRLTWFRQVALPDDWSAIWVKRRTEFKVLHH